MCDSYIVSPVGFQASSYAAALRLAPEHWTTTPVKFAKGGVVHILPGTDPAFVPPASAGKVIDFR